MARKFVISLTSILISLSPLPLSWVMLQSQPQQIQRWQKEESVWRVVGEGFELHVNIKEKRVKKMSISKQKTMSDVVG